MLFMSVKKTSKLLIGVCRSFYIHLLNMHICDKLFSQNKLIRRASRACDKYDISFIVSPRRGSET